METTSTKVTSAKAIKKKPVINRKALQFEEDRVYYVSEQDEREVLQSFNYRPEYNIYD